MRGLICIAVGAVVPVGLFVAIWGNNGPDWYLVPCVLWGVAWGSLGAHFLMEDHWL